MFFQLISLSEIAICTNMCREREKEKESSPSTEYALAWYIYSIKYQNMWTGVRVHITELLGKFGDLYRIICIRIYYTMCLRIKWLHWSHFYGANCCQIGWVELMARTNSKLADTWFGANRQSLGQEISEQCRRSRSWASEQDHGPCTFIQVCTNEQPTILCSSHFDHFRSNETTLHKHTRTRMACSHWLTPSRTPSNIARNALNADEEWNLNGRFIQYYYTSIVWSPEKSKKKKYLFEVLQWHTL